jgi:hypothetical protein
LDKNGKSEITDLSAYRLAALGEGRPSFFPEGNDMKSFILLVTWFVSGQAPSSYQTAFTSAEACNAARDAVIADGRRIKAEADQVQINAARALGAVCVAQ